MKTKVTPKLIAKLCKLAQLAKALRAGQQFSITRLTTIKSLCEDRRAAAYFVLQLAESTYDRVGKQYKPLTAKAISRMQAYVAKPTNKGKTDLYDCLRQLENIQNEYKKVHWNLVRIIRCRSTLTVEHALRSILSPDECGSWAYQAARTFAEQSDESGLSGLVAKSAPMMREIADFWCNYYFEKSSRQWLKTQE